MKRIAVFCDGTWNRSDAKHPTNVMLLNKAAKRTASDGTIQLVLYLPGVGTGYASTAVGRFTDRLFGGAFGWGLLANIEEAYFHLSSNYEVGDEIFIFGFSRGAFTARSLAGLIRSCGIPDLASLGQIPDAMVLYRERGGSSKPDADRSMRFRRTFSPKVATSPDEVAWRNLQGDSEPHLLETAYLGIWDTVGALGVPNVGFVSSAFAKLFNGDHAFHDLMLSRSVSSARHAVAIDERRRTFPPSLWGNLDDLNAGEAAENLPYQQLWFPGDHGSVGGGGEIEDLSSITLKWVAEGASARGLEFDWADLDPVIAKQNILGPLKNTKQKKSLAFKLLEKIDADRAPPRSALDISGTATARLAQDRSYRPETLRPFWPD